MSHGSHLTLTLEGLVTLWSVGVSENPLEVRESVQVLGPIHIKQKQKEKKIRE